MKKQKQPGSPPPKTIIIFVTVAIIFVGSALFRFRTVGYARMKSQLASTTQDLAVIATSASSSGGNSHHLLSELLLYTNHGELLRFFNEQLLHLNPALARWTGIKIDSPSLARDEATGRAVLGVRVETPVTISSNGRNMFPMASSNFLMLCD